MSRKGNPYDNAVMESFYRTLKRELVQDANYDNPEQAHMDIFKYIETYYNTKRIHSTLGCLTPFSLKHKILKCLSLCLVFLDLPIIPTIVLPNSTIGLDLMGSLHTSSLQPMENILSRRIRLTLLPLWLQTLVKI